MHFDTRSFRSVLFACIIIFTISIGIIYKNSLNKNELISSTGAITFLEKKYKEWPLRDYEKYKYIQIDSYDLPFEIFNGKDFMDFKPKICAIDELKPGDTVTIYYSKKESKKNINQSLCYIDKEGKTYYERSSQGMVVGIFCLLSSILLAAAAWFGYRKGQLTL